MDKPRIIPRLPLNAVEKLKRGIFIINKKKYDRNRAKRETIEEIDDEFTVFDDQL
jgi:hypothetical protein